MYTSHAHREGKWWIVQNDQHPGAMSQVARLDQAEAMQREAIAFVANVPAVTVTVRINPEIDRDLAEAAALRDQAHANEARANALRQAIARNLSARGLTMRDIGAVLGVSHQRAHQLLKN
ncbi:MAG: hypothetical protein ACRCSP_02605 [Rhodoglobus sp.]